MDSLLSRKCYATNELAVAGAIEQMVQHETLGDKVSAKNSALRHQARVQARVDSDQRHRELMAKLRNQNIEAIKVKKLTSEMVYPKGSRHE
jgi:hypothetical protein